MDVATYAQREAVAVRAVETLPGAKVSAAAVRKKGSLLNILTAIAAALVDDVEGRMSAKINALTLDGAAALKSTTELDALVAERTFRIISRKYATGAVVPLTISRTTTGATFIARGQRVDIGGVTFTLDSTIAFDPTTPSRPVTATATVAGKATNVARTAAASLDTSGLPDPTQRFTVTLDEDATGGADTETNAELLTRVRAFPLAVRRGTLAAIEFGALTVAGIRQAVAVEYEGGVYLFVADANGQCNSTLVAAVRAVMREWACGGLPPRVIGSIPSFTTIVLKLGVAEGYSPTAVREQALSVVIAAVNALAPGKTLQRSLIIAALRSVPGAVVNDDAVVSPALDLVPSTPGTSYKTREDLVVFS